MRARLALLALLFVVVVSVDRWEDRVYSAKLAALTDSLNVARAETARRDTIYVRDTVRYRETRVRWDSVRVTDTVVVDSVVYVNRDVADSTVKACDDALASCGSLVLGLRSELATTNDLLALERKRPRPPRCGLYAGYGLAATISGDFSHGVQVGAGCRLWP